MIKIIHLVRHGTHREVGKVLSGRSEIALDENGHRQAAALNDMFAGQPLVSLHCSPRRRTVETANPIADESGLQIAIAPALDEIDFGRFTGRSFTELDPDPDWREWNARRDSTRCPGGETMGEAVARARDYLLAIPPEATPALCVTHCDIIRGLVVDQLGMPFERMFALACDPGSVTTLAFENGRAQIVTLNAPGPRPTPA